MKFILTHIFTLTTSLRNGSKWWQCTRVWLNDSRLKKCYFCQYYDRVIVASLEINLVEKNPFVCVCLKPTNESMSLCVFVCKSKERELWIKYKWQVSDLSVVINKALPASKNDLILTLNIRMHIYMVLFDLTHIVQTKYLHTPLVIWMNKLFPFHFDNKKNI